MNFDEFHFTEIFSGKGCFEAIEIDDRIEIFRQFAAHYNQYNLPIMIQSITDDDVIRNRMLDFRGIIKDGLDFNNNSHLALYCLLAGLKTEKSLISNHLYEIYVDEGIRSPGHIIKTSIINGFAVDSAIKFVSSKSSLLMQFTDFIAFILNRSRWIQMNDKRGKSDLTILKIATDARFNIL